MKKLYEAPILELLAFCSDAAISGENDLNEEMPNSSLWNEGELGWT